MGGNVNSRRNNGNYSNIPGDKNEMSGNVNSQGNNGNYSNIPGDKLRE